MEIENAKVRHFWLGTGDHGFSMAITLEGPSWSQGYGEFGVRPPCDLAAAIERLLSVVGADEVLKLSGKFVRIKRDRSQIVAIGHLLEDRWFDMTDFWPKENAA